MTRIRIQERKIALIMSFHLILSHLSKFRRFLAFSFSSLFSSSSRSYSSASVTICSSSSSPLFFFLLLFFLLFLLFAHHVFTGMYFTGAHTVFSRSFFWHSRCCSNLFIPPLKHVIFSRRFRIKCTTLKVASFFRQFNAIGPLFSSFVQHHQLELRTSKTYLKRHNLVQNKNIDVQNFENIGSPLVVFHSDFFGTMRPFWTFLDSTKPLRLFRYFVMDVKQPQRVPLFTFFGTVTLLKSLILNFFSEILKSLKGPIIFCHNLQPTGVSQSPKGPPFTILSLRYSVDFGRSRLVQTWSIVVQICSNFPEITCQTFDWQSSYSTRLSHQIKRSIACFSKCTAKKKLT